MNFFYTWHEKYQVLVSLRICVQFIQRGGFYKNTRSHDLKLLKMPYKSFLFNFLDYRVQGLRNEHMCLGSY
jgi:hypothetical protein